MLVHLPVLQILITNATLNNRMVLTGVVLVSALSVATVALTSLASSALVALANEMSYRREVSRFVRPFSLQLGVQLIITFDRKNASKDL